MRQEMNDMDVLHFLAFSFAKELLLIEALASGRRAGTALSFVSDKNTKRKGISKWILKPLKKILQMM